VSHSPRNLKAAEHRRTPKRKAIGNVLEKSATFWSAVVLYRFSIVRFNSKDVLR
jgi:hypothetical protein